MSNGGVHSHYKHAIAFSKMLCNYGKKLCIHIITDGRDTPPQSAGGSLPAMLIEIEKLPNVTIATICGRYIAMDRDENFDRTELYYNLLTQPQQSKENDIMNIVQTSYNDGLYDEFICPRSLNNFQGIKSGDSVLFLNFRADRMRQIVLPFVDEKFHHFRQNIAVKDLYIATMTEYFSQEYYPDIYRNIHVIMPYQKIDNTMCDIIAVNDLKQLKISETEKYSHVTYFFNGGKETPLKGEDRVMIPSPKVATYNLQPQMSLPQVVNKLLQLMFTQQYHFIVTNFANCDMVGHTGDMNATIAAIEAIDVAIGQLQLAAMQNGYILLITADHGNCEEMLDNNGNKHTQHTTNPVPFIAVNLPENISLLPNDGNLSDIAPTVLHLLNLPIPPQITGNILVKEL
jgi:2,3-bisphosphoglycerate-independent phosphoglycerate mutase